MMSASLILVPPAGPSQETQKQFNDIVQSVKNTAAGLSDKRAHPYGGTLVWGTSNPPTIINPVLTSHSVSATLLKIIFNHLVRVNSKGEIEADLARDWQVSKDGLVYIFNLRPNVKFHDGIECTAQDIVFTLKQFMDPKNNSPHRAHFELVESVETLDQYTVRITLSKSFPFFLYKLAEREIIPKHIFDGQKLSSASFNDHPIGTGPFRFKNWDHKNNQIELEANPNYFEGRPYLDRIVVKIYPDVAQLWSAFMRQEVDLSKYISRKDYLVLEKDSTFRTYPIPSETYYSMVYNLKDSIMADIDVRRAIAHALDKKTIIETTTGEGTESIGPFHPQAFGFNSEVKPLDYNPRKSMEILRKKGWKNRDASGVLEKQDVKLDIILLVDLRSDIDRKIAMLIRQQLSEIGMKVTLQFYNGEKDLYSNPFKRFHAQAWLRSLTGIKKTDSYDVAMNWYSSSSEFARFGGYKNKLVDQLFEGARITADSDKRADIYKKIHAIIYEDQPACFLFYPLTYHAISAHLQNTDDYFSVYMPTYTMKDWYIARETF